MGRGSNGYLLLTIIAGIYIMVTPIAFKNKFHLHYPDNLYAGGFFIIIASIILLYRIVQKK